MFDTFTRQLYRAEGRDDLADALSVVPRATLQKLAFGELECGEGHKTWLEKFKGTALFDKALELMQAELEQEAQEMQNRQQSQQFYSAGDQIRLKKKLLELELARTEMGQLSEAGPIEQEAPSATAPAQGAATQASITPEPGAPPKTAAARKLATTGSAVHPANMTNIGSSIMGALSTAPKAVISAGSKPVVNSAGAQLAHRMGGATAPRAASTGMNFTNAPGGLKSLADLNSRPPPMSVASLMEKKNSVPDNLAELRFLAALQSPSMQKIAVTMKWMGPRMASGAMERGLRSGVGTVKDLGSATGVQKVLHDATNIGRAGDTAMAKHIADTGMTPSAARVFRTSEKRQALNEFKSTLPPEVLAARRDTVPKTVRGGDLSKHLPPAAPPQGVNMPGMPQRHPVYPMHDAPPPTMRMSPAEHAAFQPPPTVRDDAIPPTVRMPPVAQGKIALSSAAPIALLREMFKQAGIGQAALGFIRKNPGLAAGAVGGMAIGGVRGAQQNIDPATGQPVGGGITGALGGALTGGVVGGGLGLGAQGAIRSGLGARKAMQDAAAKGMTSPGGFVGQMGKQMLGRGEGFVRHVGELGQEGVGATRNAANYMAAKRKGFGEYLDKVHPSVELPTPPVPVAGV